MDATRTSMMPDRIHENCDRRRPGSGTGPSRARQCGDDAGPLRGPIADARDELGGPVPAAVTIFVAGLLKAALNVRKYPVSVKASTGSVPVSPARLSVNTGWGFFSTARRRCGSPERLARSPHVGQKSGFCLAAAYAARRVVVSTTKGQPMNVWRIIGYVGVVIVLLLACWSQFKIGGGP